MAIFNSYVTNYQRVSPWIPQEIPEMQKKFFDEIHGARSSKVEEKALGVPRGAGSSTIKMAMAIAIVMEHEYIYIYHIPIWLDGKSMVNLWLIYG